MDPTVRMVMIGYQSSICFFSTLPDLRLSHFMSFTISRHVWTFLWQRTIVPHEKSQSASEPQLLIYDLLGQKRASV